MDAVAELVGQHQNLTAMMGLVREHVGEHGPSGGPRWRPTAAGEFRDAAIVFAGERNRMIYSSRRIRMSSLAACGRRAPRRETR